MDFDITMDEQGNLRQAYRTRVPGLSVRIVTKDGPTAFPVQDISATGFAFTADPRGYGPGMRLTLDLLLGRRLFLQGLTATVRRVVPEAGVIGCTFEEMARHQEIRLDKLVLEVQKRLIELRKIRQKTEAEGGPPEK